MPLKPAYVEAHNNHGFALGLQGRLNEAIQQFQEALRLKPDYAEAHYNRGIALAQREHYTEARVRFQEALRLDSRLQAAHDALELVDSKADK